VHIKSTIHNSIAMSSLKTYSLAGFEPGSWGGHDVHCATTPELGYD
jgi:hypothetical protein